MGDKMDHRKATMKYYRKESAKYPKVTAPEVLSKPSNFLSTSLPREFDRYFKQMKHLKHLLAETRASFDEINQCGYFEFEEQDSPSRIIEDEKYGIAEVLKKPPCIAIFGQDSVAKAVVLREVLGETLIPLEPLDINMETQRMIKFEHGKDQSLNLSMPESVDLDDGEYEALDKKNRELSQDWTCLPPEELRLGGEDRFDRNLCTTMIDVSLPHPVLRDGGQVFVSPCNNIFLSSADVFSSCINDVFPVVIYGISRDRLSPDDIQELREVREMKPDTPFFFVNTFVKPDERNELPESQQHEPLSKVRRQLIDLGFIPDLDGGSGQVQLIDRDTLSENSNSKFTNKPLSEVEQFLGVHILNRGKFDTMKVEVGSKFVETISGMDKFSDFLQKNLRGHLVNLSTLLHNIHTYCLKTFVSTAYDLSRDCQITPKRIEYTKEQELELFHALMKIASTQLQQMKTTIHETISASRDELVTEAASFTLEESTESHRNPMSRSKSVKEYEGQIQSLVLAQLNKKIGEQLISSVNQLNDSYTGVLKRCLQVLENTKEDDQLENNSAGAALNRILDAAYHVEINPNSVSSRSFTDRFASLSTKQPTDIDEEWKKKTASRMIDGLSEAKLARSIYQQFKSKLEDSHSQFLNAIKQLERRQATKLQDNEEKRMQVRRNHAPKIARLAMESLSLRDAALYGMPKQGAEIGRGQYGVVYACDSWGQWGACAIKSLVPADDKHWNDLAMEFYYTKSLPANDRLVQLRGSVIDYSYGGGSAAALLIMERHPRDLYSGIKAHMSYVERLQVAADVVEGLRFLHNQGLVHRDIKLKNVLLDNENRGKITDLGFCKPEAMMSGSIVGTPIHMAPELFKGVYDNSVDTYAFGILFWYICAGTVRLPQNFEQCTSKEHLWTAVQKGCRPERLSIFDSECWEIMDKCWATNAADRPYLGWVQPKILNIMQTAKNRNAPKASEKPRFKIKKQPSSQG